MDILPDYLQEQIIDLKNDFQARTQFSNIIDKDFCLCYFPVYPKVVGCRGYKTVSAVFHHLP